MCPYCETAEQHNKVVRRIGDLMGREARAIKWRECPNCDSEIYADPVRLVEHVRFCKIGMVLSGIITRPKVVVRELGSNRKARNPYA